MKLLKKIVGCSFALLISIGSIFFVACKKDDSPNYIDLDKVHQNFKAYNYSYNIFMGALIERTDEDSYKDKLVAMQIENNINSQIESMLAEMKLLDSNQELSATVSIEKTETSFKLSTSKIVWLVQTNADYTKTRVNLESGALIYEVALRSEGSYFAQIIIKIEDTANYEITQIAFDGTSGSLAIKQNLDKYSSIFDNDIPSNFADSNANYYFN